MSKNSEKRPDLAVGVWLREVGEGRLRVVVDDIERRAGTQSEWKTRCFVGYIEVDRRRALEFGLSQEKYAEIGDAILARLLALDPSFPL